MLIGPGQPCMTCGKVYGQHTAKCPVPARRRAEEDAADIKRGAALLAAIHEGNHLVIGRMLRTKRPTGADGREG